MNVRYPIPEMLDKDIKMALVYFRMPNSDLCRDWFPMYTNIWEIQQKLASNINASAANLQLRINGSKPHPWIPLAGLDYEEKTVFLFDVQIFQEKPQANIASVLRTVRVLNDEDEWIDLNVQVDTVKEKKEWLGGFKNKLTDVEYLHARVQTDKIVGRFHKVGEAPMKVFNEYTQTPKFYPTDSWTQTRHDHGTQMVQKGLYTPTYNDRIIEPKNYHPYVAAKTHFPRMRMVLLFKKLCLEIISKTNQTWKEKKRRRYLKIKMDMMKRNSKEVDWKFTISTVYPTDRYGFENLYYMITLWYEDERKKLLDEFVTRYDPAYRASMVMLFFRKLTYYQKVDNLKSKFLEESERKKKMDMFDQLTKPKISRYPKGNITITETLAVQNYKILKEMYSAYIHDNYSPEERIEMLLQLKQYIEANIEPDGLLTLTELLDREVDMIAMGFKNLKGLQLRIRELLYHYFTAEDLDGNEKKKLLGPTKRCISCSELKSEKAFCKRNKYEDRFCNSCLWLRHRNSGKPPLAPFKHMLDEMRRLYQHNELSIIDEITPEEICILVNKIWNGKSSLSGCRDPYKLWLAKWLNEEEWLPWNCILLTREEAEVHEQVKKRDGFYAKNFEKEVERRHVQAKIEFKSLVERRERRLHQRYGMVRLEPDDSSKLLLEQKDPFFNSAHLRIKKREYLTQNQ